MTESILFGIITRCHPELVSGSGFWRKRGWGLRVRGRKSNKTGSPFSEENLLFQSKDLFFVLRQIVKQEHPDSDQELCRNDGIYPYRNNHSLSSRTCFGIWFSNRSGLQVGGCRLEKSYGTQDADNSS